MKMTLAYDIAPLFELTSEKGIGDLSYNGNSFPETVYPILLEIPIVLSNDSASNSYTQLIMVYPDSEDYDPYAPDEDVIEEPLTEIEVLIIEKPVETVLEIIESPENEQISSLINENLPYAD